MSDHLDRAADDAQARAAVVIEQATPADVPGYRMRYAVNAASALAAAGLLASPERDAEAADWSYQGGCPDEMGGVDEPPYCAHAEHYQPRCRPCHTSYDYKGRRPNGQFVSRQEVMPNDR